MNEISRETAYSRREFLLYDKIMAGAPTVKVTSEIDALSADQAAGLGEKLTWEQWFQERDQEPTPGSGRRVEGAPARS